MASRTCRVILFVVTLLVNTLDFISDWLFYISAKKVEKSLVYGPVDSTHVTALLFFSIIGTVGFVIEICVFIIELRNGEDFPWKLQLNLITVVFIYIEDIPQVVISLSIALCREEAISVFQLAKTGVVFIGFVVNIITTIINFCWTFGDRVKFRVVWAFFIVGIVIQLGFAIAIFVLTQTEPDNNRDVSFKVPNSVLHNHLSDERYLTDVSLFVHHSDPIFDAWNLDSDKKDSALNWMLLVPLDDIKENKYLSFKINYEHVNVQVIELSFWIAANLKTTSTIKWVLSECYSLNQDTREILLLPNSCCEDAPNNSSETYFIDLRFEDPDNGLFYQTRVLGEIFFNMKVLKSEICLDGNYENQEKNYGTLFYPLTFHYFHLNEPQKENGLDHLYRDEFNVTRFFRQSFPEMTDVADVWKTSWSKCRSTGSMEPVLDRSMQVGCV